MDAVVADEAEVERVVFCGDVCARENVPALVVHRRAIAGGVRRFKRRKVRFRQRVRLAEALHIRAEVVIPDLFCVVVVTAAAREEEDVRLDALRVENAGRQAQDRVEVAFLHEVAADGGAVALGEEHIVRQDDGGAGLSVRFEAAVDVLEEIQLLVARLIREVIARRALAALLRADTKSLWKIYLYSINSSEAYVI